MEKAEIEDRVRAFFVEELEIAPEKVLPEAGMKNDLGIDSLDYVDVAVFVENEFGFKPNLNDMKSSATLGQFVAYISTHVK